MILCYSSVNSTYPCWCEEMPVSVRCIAIGCKCFLSFCKQVISTSGTKHFIGKAETLLNWANFGTSHRMLLTGHFQRTDGIEKETSSGKTRYAKEKNPNVNWRAATLCVVQWWWGLHMRSIKHLEALVIYYWQMQKNGYTTQTVKKKRRKSPLIYTTTRQCFSIKPRLHSPRSV